MANALRVTLGGIAFGAYYLLTGSIWLPIIAHALVDLLQGAMVYEYLRERPSSPALEPAPAEMPARRD
jgi:membrane protease YdiL (CAAX protease family)